MQFESFIPFSIATRKMLARVGIALCFFLGVGCIGYGVWAYVGATQAYGAGGDVEVVVCNDENEETTGTSRQAEKIVVAVSGAVKNPGMYEMEPGARVGDLVSAAGVYSAQVDTLFVETALNLARELQDGEGVYIPPKADADVLIACSELSTVLQAARAPAAKTPSSTTSNSQLISINSATAAELDTLPGIGAARAQAIIDGRPYGTLAELVERKVLSESLFSSLENLIQL